MADIRITEMVAVTAPNAADLLHTVTDVAGTPTNQKVRLDVILEYFATPPTTTTAFLEDVGNAVNTDASKIAGALRFNTTTNKPVYAVGSADASVWVDATGSTAHTPV